MPRRAATICLTLLVLCPAWAGPATAPKEPPRTLHPLILEGLRAATRVDAYRLGGERFSDAGDRTDAEQGRPRRPRPAKLFEGRELIASATVGDAGRVRAAADLFADPSLYELGDNYNHVPMSMIVLLRFRLASGGGEDVLDVEIDFSDDKAALSRSGETILGGWGYGVRPGRARLIALAREFFPNDPLVRALPAKPDRARRGLGDAAEVLDAPDKVEALRLGEPWFIERLKLGQPKAPEPAGREKVGRFPVTGHGPPVDGAVARAVADALADDDTYDDRHGFFAACFDPGVAFRYTKGTRTVASLVCFKCRNLQVIDMPPRREDDPSPRPLSVLSPHGWRRLAHAARRAFPDDPEIQKLGKPGTDGKE